MKKPSRTTLFVVEKEEWVNAKSIAEKMGYNSVSEYIFDLLKANREYEIYYHSLLLEIEKYYELEHYTLGLTADRAGFSEKILINLMQNLRLPFPEEKRMIYTDRIHDLLLENRLYPREADSFLKLKIEMQKRPELANADILCSIFPNDSDRTAEVLTVTRDILFHLTENNSLKELLRNCRKLENSEDYSNLRSVYGRLALQYDSEALLQDPIIEDLKREKCIQLFGRVLEYTSILLIMRELTRIENFRFYQFPIIKPEYLEKIKAETIKQKESIEIKLPYLINVKDTVIKL